MHNRNWSKETKQNIKNKNIQNQNGSIFNVKDVLHLTCGAHEYEEDIRWQLQSVILLDTFTDL